MRSFARYSFNLAPSEPVSADTYVRGHTRQDGTYVQPHYRSNPDNNRLNNFSTEGNYNPYTGKAGTVDPYKPTNPSGYGSNNLNNNSLGSTRRW
jgi:hypothetical protein